VTFIEFMYMQRVTEYPVSYVWFKIPKEHKTKL
jgi:hypothetical protein